jgi:hypothetical protein
VASMPVQYTPSGGELTRDVNERTWSLTDAESIDIRCECGSEACPEVAHLPRLTYERARNVRAGFIIVPGHEHLGTERVTELGERYALIEKRAELAGTGPG